MKTFEKGFNKKNLNVLREKLNAVLAEAGMDELQFEVGNMRYTEAEVKINLVAKVNGIKSTTDYMLEAEMRIHNLKKTGRGGEVLVSYEPRKYKYPFIYEKNGKRYKCSTTQAKFLFAA